MQTVKTFLVYLYIKHIYLSCVGSSSMQNAGHLISNTMQSHVNGNINFFISF